MSRPRVEIDKKQFENLCKLQCTKEEIAGWFNVSDDTIERWCKREYKENFAVVFAQKRQAGKISVRRAQWHQAVDNGNVTMLIWLGKQMLCQTDKVEQNVTVEDDGLIEALKNIQPINPSEYIET